MKADLVKAIVLSYMRYDRQCPVVALEASNMDVAAVTKARRLVEIEVKTSISDLRSDKRKRKHQLWGKEAYKFVGFRYSPEDSVSRFYFAVPYDLKEKAVKVCEELYPYAGLLAVKVRPNWPYYFTWEARKAKVLSAKRLPLQELIELVKSQSATVCRLALAVGRNGHQIELIPAPDKKGETIW